ncbi:hypothetical protein LRAMOSA11112 [Lichtheimia ramosa]|uniref:Heterokaryon incompatibility domain-containing protein n=1 Tax=Lichtheimia ramosa TaxID=688394 RepID=A0A077WSQ2_9FUNG|nr:hypothetical protein LRAMOSA11112 [Lichtheimia ramosa]
MSIIRPCHSSYHRWKVKSKGYYALSHLWGNAKDFPYWDVGTFITQDKHPVDPIPMRPEKRETLLALLKQHPDTYWWIDVLCARTDTPLVIMGDIYKHAKACYAMLDCAPELITRIWKNANYFNALRETYERFISGMCDESKNVHVMFDESQTFKMTAIRSIAEKHSWVLDTLCSLFQSSWFDRVWTLQEIALPAKTIMISEQCGFATIEHQISFDLLSGFLYNLDADSDCIDFLSGLVDEKMSLALNALAKKFWTIWVTTANTTDLTINPSVDPACKAIELLNKMDALGKCQRTCMDPKDYVYGVLGLLRVHVPRMDDRKQVWTMFLSALDDHLNALPTSLDTGEKLLTLSEHASDFDLALAKDMGDVYDGLLQNNIDWKAVHEAMYEFSA